MAQVVFQQGRTVLACYGRHRHHKRLGQLGPRQVQYFLRLIELALFVVSSLLTYFAFIG
jgi:hypothetical protein